MLKGFSCKAKGCDTHPVYRAVAFTGHQQAATPRGQENRGRETAPYPAYRVALGSSELHFPLRCGELALALCTGGHAPQAAKGATRQKANYSKDLSPAYREVAQHKAGLVTQGAGSALLKCNCAPANREVLLPREPLSFAPIHRLLLPPLARSCLPVPHAASSCPAATPEKQRAPLDLRTNNPTTQGKQETQHPGAARHTTTQPQKPLHPPAPSQFIPSKTPRQLCSPMPMRCGAPASAAEGHRGGQTGQMELGTQTAAAKGTTSLLTGLP